MKIRIKDNSVRFRLTRSEVDLLGRTGSVSCTTEFIGYHLVYTIESSADTELYVSFIENKIVLKMPEEMVMELVTTDRVGFDGQSGLVKVLVEKDFVCIDNSIEDQSDNYPNPNLEC
ncbi:hypothetical protein LUD75_18665 [Epilithonimonas sp. JDS]|uniref:DUF7009 family protein n=1 Tax=Epilithonimonas sp. JDS TaxID=2902797 RepID=UPI001E50C8C8|nr:hypothetical protein [Epilithonimonas sp. JDS]MCD9856753.1 hypothetical protein [Epilithonimonas sp. JDS]